jgi:hypothetical protein
LAAVSFLVKKDWLLAGTLNLSDWHRLQTLAASKHRPNNDGLCKRKEFMKAIICALALATGLLLTIGAIAQDKSSDDEAAIKATALNYIEGWYDGDAARMESALHPELAKRIILTRLLLPIGSTISKSPGSTANGRSLTSCGS